MKASLVSMFFFICAASFVSAKSLAAAAPSTDFTPQLIESTYAPERQRDPFDRGERREVKPATTEPVIVPAPPPPPKPKIPASLFRLQAILRDRGTPVAVVNGELLELNKIVTMQVGANRYRVKPVEIGRERVILEVEGQKIEVRLEEPSPHQKSK